MLGPLACVQHSAACQRLSDTARGLNLRRSLLPGRRQAAAFDAKIRLADYLHPKTLHETAFSCSSRWRASHRRTPAHRKRSRQKARKLGIVSFQIQAATNSTNTKQQPSSGIDSFRQQVSFGDYKHIIRAWEPLQEAISRKDPINSSQSRDFGAELLRLLQLHEVWSGRSMSTALHRLAVLRASLEKLTEDRHFPFPKECRYAFLILVSRLSASGDHMVLRSIAMCVWATAKIAQLEGYVLPGTSISGSHSSESSSFEGALAGFGLGSGSSVEDLLASQYEQIYGSQVTAFAQGAASPLRQSSDDSAQAASRQPLTHANGSQPSRRVDGEDDSSQSVISHASAAHSQPDLRHLSPAKRKALQPETETLVPLSADSKASGRMSQHVDASVDDTERNLLEASGSFNGRDSSGSEKHGTPGKGRLDRTAASSGRQASEDSLDGAEKGTSQPVRQPLKLRRRRVLPGNLLSSLDRLSELWLESKEPPTSQSLCNFVWGLAHLGYSPLHSHLFRSIQQQAVGLTASMSPQDVSNFWWAYGELREPLETQLLESLAKRTLSFITRSSLPAISVPLILMACARLRVQPLEGKLSDALLDYLRARNAQPLKRLTPESLTTTIAAAAVLRPRGANDFAEVWAAQFLRRSEEFSFSQALVIVKACRKLGVKPLRGRLSRVIEQEHLGFHMSQMKRHQRRRKGIAAKDGPSPILR